MTSLPIVPSKYYQVCRLCLTVVSDTNELSVFGSHNAACIANTTATNSTTVKDCNSSAVNASSNNNNTNTGSGSSSNVGVIVKTNRNNSTPTSEHKNTAASNNASDNEAIAAAAAASGRDSGNDGRATTAEAAESSRGNNPGDDDNNNFKIDGDLHQSDILERIHTFLSITVSGRTFYPSFAQFFVFIFLHISSAFTEHVYKLCYLH